MMIGGVGIRLDKSEKWNLFLLRALDVISRENPEISKRVDLIYKEMGISEGDGLK